MITASIAEALTGGFGAVLGPGLAMSLAAVVAIGIATGPALSRRELSLAAVVFALMFAAATWRRGIGVEGTFSLALGLGSFPVAWACLRASSGGWRAPLLGLVVASVAILWRIETFGPVLAELRGGWQAGPDAAGLAIYHFATAVSLAAWWMVAGEGGRLLPTRLRFAPFGIVAVASATLVLTGTWSVVVRLLLMRWPYVPLG